MTRVQASAPQTISEERRDVGLAQQGNTAALARLIAAQIRQINRDSIASAASLEWDDAVAAGTMGFIEAVMKFDLSRTTRLYTYAGFYVRQAVQVFRQNQAGPVVIPFGAYTESKARSDSTVRAVQRAHKYSSLDSPMADGEETLGTMFVTSPSFENDTVHRMAFETALKTLPEQQRVDLLTWAAHDYNAASAGKALGITGSRLRQRLAEAKAAMIGILGLYDPDNDLAN